MDGHCFAVLHSLNEKQNGLNCFRGSRFFFKQQKILFWSWRPFLEHFDPFGPEHGPTDTTGVFFSPLDDPSSHLFVLKEEAINSMQNRRYLHDFQIAVFFAGGVGGGWGVESCHTWRILWWMFEHGRHFLKRDTSIMRRLPIAAIAVLRFAGQAFYYLDIYHIEHAMTDNSSNEPDMKWRLDTEAGICKSCSLAKDRYEQVC